MVHELLAKVLSKRARPRNHRHRSTAVVATQFATQLSGIGWQLAASTGTPKRKNLDGLGLFDTSQNRTGPPQRFPKPKVGGSRSRVAPVQMAMRNYTRDEGRSFEVSNQVLISSCWRPIKRMLSQANLAGARVLNAQQIRSICICIILRQHHA
jgi:hypothetical protein